MARTYPINPIELPDRPHNGPAPSHGQIEPEVDQMPYVPTVNGLTRKEPWSQNELDGMRAYIVSAHDVTAFTCDDCGARFTCELVFDPYNTDGDCLAEK